MPSRQPDRTSSPESVAEEMLGAGGGAAPDDTTGSGAGASLDQFRQVLEDQRRQTAQLQSLLESRFGSESGGGAADKVETLVSKIETLASRLDSIGNGGNGHVAEKPAVPPQVSGLMLRVGELERKISEATPEPLLKEIVFRLGSLEDAVGQTPDGGGIGEIRERVKALERRKSEQVAPDPRIDELAARLHSFEDHAAGAASTARLEKLKEQIESLRAAVERGGRDGLEAIEGRIAAIENAAATPGAAADDSPEWAARLEAVESWGARIGSIEEKTAAPDPRLEEISGRLAKLDSLDGLTERLRKVEEIAAAAPRDPRVDEIESRIASLAGLTERLEAVEIQASEPPADPRVSGIEPRLNALEQSIERVAALEKKAAEPACDPRVDEINARLGAMADVAHISDVESRVSSLTTRLDALKMITDGLKATHKPGGIDAGPRLDAMAAQIDGLKAQIAARGEGAGDAGHSAWEALQQRIESLETHGTPTAHDPRFTELAAQLTALENSARGGADPRVTEILARLNTMEQPNAGPVQAAIPPELIARIDALEKRLSGASAKGTDPIVAQLRERWEVLEERMMRLEEGLADEGQSEGDQTAADLRGQVAELREKLQALGRSEGAAGLDSQTVASLLEIANNPPPAAGGFDLGTVKSQMTFVYFSIGMLYAICAYAGFVMLSSN